MTHRYLARLNISSRCPFSFSFLVVFRLYRLVKMSSSALLGFTESPVVRNQMSTIFNVCCTTPISSSECIPRTMARISSAYQIGWHSWSVSRCNSSSTTRLYSRGDSTHRCGHPESTIPQRVVFPLVIVMFL